MSDFYYNTTIPFSKLLAKMSYQGIRVDLDRLRELESEFKGELQHFEKEVYNVAGKKINIGSNQQLAKLLYQDLKIPNYVIDYMENKKTGEWEEYKDEFLTDGEKEKRYKKIPVVGTSTGATQLNKIRLINPHPIISPLLEYKQVATLLDTFIIGIYEHLSPYNRVHPSWFTLTSGARIKCSKPNVANIPSRSVRGRKIKSIYIPQPGYSFFEADYSQMELRFMAWFSQDPTMLAAYRDGLDLHALTTSKRFNIPYEEAIKSPKRKVGKETNFLMSYIGGPYILQGLLAKQGLWVTLKECSEFIDSFFQTYPYVKNLHNTVETKMLGEGYVENLFGRKRYFDFKDYYRAIDKAPNQKTKNDAEYALNRAIKEALKQAVSHVIQGSSTGDYSAFKTVNAAKIAEGLGGRVWNVLYDGIFFEVKDEKAGELQKEIKAYLELPEKPVTIEHPVDISKAGKSWALLK
ncbi:MAG: DNA polymerase A family protein [Lutibacter sp.]